MDDRLSDLLSDELQLDDTASTETETRSPDTDGAWFGTDTESVDDFLPAPRRGLRLPTLIMVLVLAMAIAFGGGVLVQKHHDRHLTSASASLPGLGSGALPNLGAGGVPDFGGQGGSTGGGSSSSDTSSSKPVVIGKVVSVDGTTLTVRDLGGKTHLVRTNKNTKITVTGDVTGLHPGVTVSVVGTASGTTVTATSITAR